MLPRSWSVTINTIRYTKPIEAIRITDERTIAMCSCNLVCADLWETNMTVTEVGVMKTRTIILYKNIHKCYFMFNTKTKLNSVALVRTRTIPTERPPPVGEVSANFCG